MSTRNTLRAAPFDAALTPGARRAVTTGLHIEHLIARGGPMSTRDRLRAVPFDAAATPGARSAVTTGLNIRYLIAETESGLFESCAGGQ